MTARKKKAAMDKETNPTAYNRLQRNQLNCSYCPPHRGENSTQKKRGVKKPKGKRESKE